MVGHYDYRKDCTDWMKTVTALYEENAVIFGRQLKNLNKLKDTCTDYGNNMDEIWNIDLASLGGRTETIS